MVPFPTLDCLDSQCKDTIVLKHKVSKEKKSKKKTHIK